MPGAKGINWSNGLLLLLFNAVEMANIAQNVILAPLTNLWVSLHTIVLSDSADQTTNEAAYSNYSRVAVPRSVLGWTVADAIADPVETITFPTATGGNETEVAFGIGTAAAGPGVLLYYGIVSPTLLITTGITPSLTSATMVTED